MPIRRALRGIMGLIAWAPAAVGALALLVAWRCRTDVRTVWLRVPSHVSYGQVTPGHVDVAFWNRYEYDAVQHKTPILVIGDAWVLTTTEPVGDEAATLAEKVADATRSWHAAGFGYVHGNDFPPATPTLREVWIPTWTVIVAAFAPLAVVTLARVRRRRMPANPGR